MPASLRIVFVPGRDIAGMAEAWDRLYAADPESHFFLSRGFLDPIFARFETTGAFVCLEGETPVGILPVSVETLWDEARECFRTEYRMAGSKHWADYSGILIDPAAEAAVIDAYARHFRQSPWGRIRFKNLRMSDRRQDRFFAQFEKSVFGVTERKKIINEGTTNNLVCPVIRLPESFDAYTSALSKNNRKNMRKHLRRVEEGEYGIRAGTAEDLADFERLWLAQWGKGSSGKSRARRYAETIRIGLAQGTVHLPVLSDREGHTLGMICNFHDPVRRDIGCFVSARAAEAGSVPVALILHGHCIRRAIDEGYATYDFLRGDEPYKFDMGAEARAIRYPVLRRRTAAPAEDLLSPLSAQAVLRDLPDLAGTADAGRIRTACAQLARFF